MTDNPQTPSRMSRRSFLKAGAITLTGLTASGVGGYVYSGVIEPNTIEVTQLTVPLKGLSPEFDGYRLVHLSDIHMGTWMNRERLTNVINLVNEQDADLIALTGDYITHDEIPRYHDPLVDNLVNLRAQDGVVSTLGNHDHWTNAGLIREILQASNIQELENDSLILERGNAKFAISGVDDVWEEKADIDKVIDGLPDEAPAILLVHEPDYADISGATGRFGLQLAGHTHGGQIRLPVIGALRLPYLGTKYDMGKYQVGDMIHYTNRGVGMIPPQYRLGCLPEITVVTFTPATD